MGLATEATQTDGLIHGALAMSMITPTQPMATPAVSEWVPSSESLYRLTVDEYERIADGLDSPVELVDGYLVAKMTKKPPHVIACEKTRDALMRTVSAGWRVMSEAPVRIPEYNEPEPDLALARGTVEDYLDRHPGPADVGLVVEVADSSLRRDRKRAHVYGPSGIPVYWIVNLVDRQVEVYSTLGPDGYGPSEILKPGQAVPVVIDGIKVGQIAVSDILP